MKSNVCKIENGNKDLEAILKESENVANYNGFTQKQALQLRLLCEEIDGLLPNIIDEFDGEFWIEYDKGVCKLNLAIKIAEFSASKKKELINVAKNKKNAAATGIIGKLRSAIEDFFLGNDTLQSYGMSLEYYHMAYGVNYDNAHLWSLDQYKNVVQQEKDEVAYDELEKSIIAAIADDVVVGVKGRQATVVITKKFA